MRRATRHLGGLWSDQRGSIAVLAAASLLILIAAGALAVDIGAAYFEGRRLQGAADAAALAAAGDPGDAASAADLAVHAVPWDAPVQIVVAPGTYTPDGRVAPAARFVAGGGRRNAARVTLVTEVPTYLAGALGFRRFRITRRATAARLDLAAFSLGSRLASLHDGIANQLLGALAGSSVTLTAIDYEALARADVDVLAFLGLLRTELGLTAASFDQVLAATITVPQALRAVSATLAARGDMAAAAAITQLAGATAARPITLDRLVDLGAAGEQDVPLSGTSIDVGALSLAEALLQAGSGTREVSLTIGSAIPGLTDAVATLVTGARAAQSPWLAVAEDGEVIVRTAQTRILITANVPATPVLASFGIAAIRLPLYVELAEAEARLSAIQCDTGRRVVTVQVHPSPGHAAIADVPPAALKNMSAVPPEPAATLVALPALRITGSARLDAGDGGWQTTAFDGTEIANGTIKTVEAGGPLRALAASLASRINLSVTAGGTTQSTAPVLGLLRPALALAAGPLDAMLRMLLDTLGVHLGQADVRVDGLRCGVAALVG